MKKSAWPWVGTTEHEMGSMMGNGDHRGFPADTSYTPDTLVPEKSVVEEADPAYNYEGGKVSPSSEDQWDHYWKTKDPKMEPAEASDKLISFLDEGSRVLDVGCGDGRHAEYLKSQGYDVVGIDRSKRALNMASDSFDKVVGDIRYHNFGQIFDGFQALSSLEHVDDYKLALKNIYSHLRPKAFGLVHLEKDLSNLDSFKNALDDAGFSIYAEDEVTLHDNNQQPKAHYEIIVQKNENDKVAQVSIYNDDGQIAVFACDIAKTFSEKTAGLQVYPQLDKTAGLLFEYEVPQDVTYHMGTVAYPIDIIFVDSESKIKKICKDIQPGALGTFGSSDITWVLEICGGLSDRLKLTEGMYIDVEKDGFTSDILQKYSSLSSDLSIAPYPVVVTSDESSVENLHGVPVFVGDVMVSDIIDAFPMDDREIKVFDIDVLLKGSSLKFYMITDGVGKTARASLNHTVQVGLDNGAPICIEVPATNISDERDSNWTTVYSLNESFANFIPKCDELSDITSRVRRGERVALASRMPNLNSLSRYIRERIDLEVGSQVAGSVDFISLAPKSTSVDLISAAYEKYRTKNISLVKNAGISIPDDVKAMASKALVYFERAHEETSKSIEKLQTNLNQYETIQDDVELIYKTKGQYNNSIKRNIRVVKRYLMLIRNGLEIMDKIKDISTTQEIMDTIVRASKIASDSAEDVFKLVDKMESPDFYMNLSEKTQIYQKNIEDLHLALKRMIDYINADILGVVILSD